MSYNDDEEDYMNSLDCWDDISHDERMDKLLRARKMFSMARRLDKHFPEIARTNREIAEYLWRESKVIKRGYRK